MFLFTYGTLMNGEMRNFVLEEHGSTFLGAEETYPKYKMYHLGGFPAVIPSKKGHSIKGEVWDINDKCLADIDMIEGHPNFYRRKTIGLPSGKTVYMYIIDNPKLVDRFDDLPEIESGDWKDG